MVIANHGTSAVGFFLFCSDIANKANASYIFEPIVWDNWFGMKSIVLVPCTLSMTLCANLPNLFAAKSINFFLNFGCFHKCWYSSILPVSMSSTELARWHHLSSTLGYKAVMFLLSLLGLKAGRNAQVRVSIFLNEIACFNCSLYWWGTMALGYNSQPRFWGNHGHWGGDRHLLLGVIGYKMGSLRSLKVDETLWKH